MPRRVALCVVGALQGAQAAGADPIATGGRARAGRVGRLAAESAEADGHDALRVAVARGSSLACLQAASFARVAIASAAAGGVLDAPRAAPSLLADTVDAFGRTQTGRPGLQAAAPSRRAESVRALTMSVQRRIADRSRGQRRHASFRDGVAESRRGALGVVGALAHARSATGSAAAFVGVVAGFSVGAPANGVRRAESSTAVDGCRTGRAGREPAAPVDGDARSGAAVGVRQARLARARPAAGVHAPAKAGSALTGGNLQKTGIAGGAPARSARADGAVAHRGSRACGAAGQRRSAEACVAEASRGAFGIGGTPGCGAHPRAEAHSGSASGGRRAGRAVAQSADSVRGARAGNACPPRFDSRRIARGSVGGAGEAFHRHTAVSARFTVVVGFARVAARASPAAAAPAEVGPRARPSVRKTAAEVIRTDAGGAVPSCADRVAARTRRHRRCACAGVAVAPTTGGTVGVGSARIRAEIVPAHEAPAILRCLAFPADGQAAESFAAYRGNALPAVGAGHPVECSAVAVVRAGGTR